MRNHYEAAIGRFNGQMEGGGVSGEGAGGVDAKKKAADGDANARGAEYINPKMRKNTDFAS